MFTSSVTNSTRAHHHALDNDNAVAAQNKAASAKPKEKAAASTSKKPQFAEDKRYNAAPMASSSGQARVAKLTRSQATLHNDSLQRTPPRTPERGGPSTQHTPTRTPPRTPGREGMAFQPTPPGTPGRSSGPSLQRVNASKDNPVLTQITEDMKASHKANRADPLPDPNNPDRIPKRLQEKMDAIDLPKLKKLDKTLHDHAASVIEDIVNNDAPNASTTRRDAKLLPMFAKAENSRHPDLNLHVFSAPADCYDAIRAANKDVQSSKEPISMRVVYRPFKGLKDHHIALDVKLRPGHRPSVVAFEAAAGNIGSMLESALKKELPDMKSKVVHTNAQSSHWDCAMFAMSNALKAHQHEGDYMAQLHKGQTVPIPADFLKHAQSKARVAAAPNKDELVTKDKAGPHKETLEHRNFAYRTQRFDNAYSTSIEGFRLQEIKRAGEYLETQGASSSPAKVENKTGGLFSFLRK